MLIGNSFALADYAWKNWHTESPMCHCGKSEETAEHFFLACDFLSRFQYTALKLIIGTSTKFDQLAAEILCGLPPMQLQIDIITIKFGIKLSQQQDILWKLYLKCQLPERKSDKNLIDDFYKVTGATNCYTVSTCNEYLRSRWNRIFKNALTTTTLA